MSGGQQKYLNMSGQTRITPVGGMNNRVLNQHHPQQQQQHPQYSHQTHHQQPQPMRIMMSSQGKMLPGNSPMVQQAKSLTHSAYSSNINSHKSSVLNKAVTHPSAGKQSYAAAQQATFATPKAHVLQKGAAASASKAAQAGPSSSSAGVAQAKQRRKVVKVNKGLRHFSMKVCEKVKEKGTTTYNEVADELVEDEMRRVEASGDRSFDQKNIRRRVYDALNVLMAMNIIAKEKKEIHWLGLPTNTPAQCANLDEEIAAKREAIQAKEKELRDLLLLQVSLKNLVNRNRESEEQGYIPTPNSHIQLPFIVVNTHRDTRIHCTISQDKTEYFFKFDDKFELNDHVTVLQRMGLLMGLDTGTSSERDIEKLKQLVPVEFQSLIEDYGRGKTSVDVPPQEQQHQQQQQQAEEEEVAVDQEDIEEYDDTLIEYVDVSTLASQQMREQEQEHEMIEEEYSEEDTIIEEAY